MEKLVKCSTSLDSVGVSWYNMDAEKSIISVRFVIICSGKYKDFLIGPNEQYSGYTKKTGRCLVSAAERDGITLIAVTLGAPDDWNDHKKMLDYGFSNTELKPIINQGDVLKEYVLDNGNFNAIAKNDFSISVKKNSSRKADVVLHTVNKPTVKIQKGEKVGYAECFIGKQKIGEVDLVADNDAEGEPVQQSFLQKFASKIKKMLLKL